MKINFDIAITDLDGNEIKNSEKREEVVTLKHIAIMSLMNPVPKQNSTENGAIKFSRYQLAQKINVGGEVEITAEEISTLKEKIAESYSPLIVGRSYDILESNNKK